MGPKGRVRVLLHSIAFGNLKLLVAEKHRAHRRGDARARARAGAGRPARAASRSGGRALRAGLRRPARGRLAAAVSRARAISTPTTSPAPSTAWAPACSTGRRTCTRAGSSRPDARVFGLTSEGNTLAWKGYAAVSAAKVALEAVARSIAVEFAPYGVRCNVIQAGVTETPALARDPGQRGAQGARRGCGIPSAGSPPRATSRTPSTCSRSTTPPGSTAS